MLRRLFWHLQLRVQRQRQRRLAHAGGIFGLPFGRHLPGAPATTARTGLDKCTIALAAFDLEPGAVGSERIFSIQPYNDYLIRWFNRALASFPDQVTPAERQRHFAWTTTEVKWEDFVYPQALHNPFQGAYPAKDKPAGSCRRTTV